MLLFLLDMENAIMPKKSKCCDLKSCFMCWYSEVDWLDVIENERQTKSYKKGEVIFSEGTPTNAIYFLLEGNVKVHKHWGEGKELILHFSKAGEIFGYRGLGEDQVYPVTATVLSPCVVCFIGVDVFNQLLEGNHKLALQFLKFHLAELGNAEKRMRDLALMDVKGRIADMLLMLATRFGVDDKGYIALQLKRQDMAAYAGTTYETFFRMTSELIAEKTIEVSGKCLKIVDKTKLEFYCSRN